METRFAARLRLGEDVIGELDAAVATAPYREGLWELLITALYREGRQADALAAYQRVRTRLVDELGLEPGPRLKEIEHQILTQDTSLGVAREPAVACSRAGARDGEIAALRDLLVRHRLVEVVGPGGIGKTAVAIATGRTLVDVHRLVRPARGRADRGRRTRHGRRRARRRRRRGGAARAPAPDGSGADPRQLRARGRRRRGARGAPARCGADAADPVHQPGRRSSSQARPCSSSRRWRSTTPSSSSRSAQPGRRP